MHTSRPDGLPEQVRTLEMRGEGNTLRHQECENMRTVRNITVAVTPELYRQTRMLAAEYNSTVTAGGAGLTTNDGWLMSGISDMGNHDTFWPALRVVS
jgi:hypothetical protein